MKSIRCTVEISEHEAQLFEVFNHRVIFEDIQKRMDTKDDTYAVLHVLEHLRLALRNSPAEYPEILTDTHED